MPRKRTRATVQEKALGVQGTVKALDWFQNLAARTGFGTPNLAESTQYEMVRFSYDYWALITLYRNHWISRRIVDTPAQDMVRTWPKLTSEIEPKDGTKIDRVIRRTQTKINILTATKWGRLFGGAGALMVIDGHENKLDEPLDYDDIEIGAYKGVIPFDRWSGIQPEGDVSTDINFPVDFNKPVHYTVRAHGGETFKVHCSRVLRFNGPEVPSPEREASSWWGISSLEPVYEEIRKRDNMSWNILSLTFRANILGMKIPELAQLMSGVGSPGGAGTKFEQQMSTLNHLMSNQSLIPLPKDGGIESSQYSFAGLSDVYQQFQLDISGAAQIPVTRLWGRTISGLGQSNDADERIYEERIASDQDTDMRPQLEKLYPVICMSELGEVPDDLDLAFPSVRVLDEKEKSELAKTTVDTVTVALNSGGISPRTYAQELKQSSDTTGIFTNITDEQIEKLSDDVQPEGEIGLGGGLFGEEGGETNLSPSSGPQKVLKEEKTAKAADSAMSPELVWIEACDNEALTIPRSLRGTDEGQALLQKNALANLQFYAEQFGVPYDRCVSYVKSRGIYGATKLRARDADGPVTGMRRMHGMDIMVETVRGGVRSGDGWSQTMPAHYGYIKGVKGADGDSLDCYVGDDPASEWAYVIDQRYLPPRTGFDEHKVMLGFGSQGDALRAYKAGHHRAEDVYMDFTPMHVSDLKCWMASGDLNKPCSLA